MVTNKITPSVEEEYWSKCLDNTSLEPTNLDAIKVPKILELASKITLGTSIINSPMSPPSLPGASMT